jgi:hypothetical protein
MNTLIKEKINFFYNSINDAREIIKMIDIKANFLIFLLVITVGSLLKISQCPLLKIIVVLAGLIIISYIFLFVVSPRNNPKNEIQNISSYLAIELQDLFYPHEKRDFEQCFKNINKITDEETLLNILIFERLKLQVIIEKKDKHLKIALKLTIYLFFVLLFVFLIFSLF